MVTFVLIAACAAVQACSSIRITYVDAARRSPTESASVQVFEVEPSRPFRVVARFQLEDKGWNFSRAQIERRIRNEAARLGGQAVIIDERVESHFVSEGLLIGHTAEVSQRVIVARVVVFRENGAR